MGHTDPVPELPEVQALTGFLRERLVGCVLTRLDVSAGGSLAAAIALLLHQLTLLGQIVLHAAWLASALAVTARRADTPESGRPRQ